MLLKKIIRKVVRSALFARPTETIPDAISRHKLYFKRKIDFRQLDMATFQQMLNEMDIQSGDVLIVHAAWRGCYALKAAPEDVLNELLQRVGEAGTVLMPCYGADSTFFDVKSTPSAAGVLSEQLRNLPKAVRSGFSSGAMCGVGLLAETILSSHLQSQYAFDEQSPYYKAIIHHNAKVLLIGLPLNTAKITAVHCGAYDAWFHSEQRHKHYKQSNSATTVIDQDGVSHAINPYQRVAPGPCKKNYRMLFKKTPKITRVQAGVRLTIFRGKDIYAATKAFCQAGGKLYK